MTTPIDLPPGVSEVFIEPDEPKKGRKGLLVGIGAAVLVAVAVVVAVFVVGSGDSEATYSLTAAAKGAAEAKNVAFEMKMSVAGQDITATSRLDVEHNLMAMEMNMPALSDSGDIGMIIDVENKVMYLDASAMPAGADLPTDWISMDLSQVPGADQSFGSLAESNPLDTAKLFEGAKTVEDKGVEEVDGEQLKHYLVTVDTAEALAKQPSLRDRLEQAGQVMPDTIEYDVWITEGNEMRRMSFTLEMAGQKIVTDMKVIAIGEIDPIVLPSPDEVTDMSKMLGGG